MANNISNCQRTIVDANLTNPTSISKTFIQRNEKGLPIKDGEYITFISANKQLLELDSLSSNGAKLLNVKNNSDNSQQAATIFIPENKKEKLIGKIEK